MTEAEGQSELQKVYMTSIKLLQLLEFENRNYYFLISAEHQEK